MYTRVSCCSYTAPIHWAVIGVGHIGRRHAEHISNHPQAELSAFVDVLAREACAAKFYPDTPLYASVSEMLEDQGDTLKIASVCVPNGLHYSIALELLEGGVSLLIEKPITLYPEQVDHLQQVAHNRGLQIYSVLQNRFTPVSAWLHQILQEGRLGRIYQLEMQCHWNRDDRYYLPRRWHGDRLLDGGTLFTQYSHFIDLLIWCFGMPHVEAAQFYNHNHIDTIDFEDSGFIHLCFPGNIPCAINYSTAVYGANRGVRLTILAERGCIEIDGPFMNHLTHCTLDGANVPDLSTSVPANAYEGYSGSAQNHHLVIDHTLRALLGDHTAQAVPACEAQQVVTLIRDIYRANPWLME